MKSVKEYLETKGFRWKQKGELWVTNSPYKPGGDSNPSFILYPSGVFKCYATGTSGNAITLARHFGDDLEGISDWEPKPSPPKEPLPGYIPPRYTEITLTEAERIKQYAEGRRITSGYEAGVWVMKDKTRWPSLIFPHYDENFTICGAKFRLIDGVNGNRMRTAGRVGFYILDARTSLPPVTYLIESETSANSLWEYCKQERKSAVVISCGSVGTVPRNLPFDYPLKKIIDYDNNPLAYNKRIEKYNHLKGQNIKLKLGKGEDVNSLMVSGELWRIDFLL